jgi:hypothetical protein
MNQIDILCHVSIFVRGAVFVNCKVQVILAIML